MSLSPVLVKAAAPEAARQPAKASVQQAANKYIVVFKDGANGDDLQQKLSIVRERIFSKVLNGFSATLSDDQLKKLKADSRVAFIEPDVVVTTQAQPRTDIDWNEFKRRFGWSSSKSSSSVSSRSSVSSTPSSSSSANSSVSGNVSMPTGIDRIETEKSVTAALNNQDGTLNVDVAIIDTGIDSSHPDLNVFKSVNMINGGTGNDDNGHGTHVAGTVAAKDNGTGVVGVAPGARLWAVKVLGADGSGLMSNIIAGVDYVAQNASQIEVANMSLGCSCTSSALNQAIQNAVNAGVVFAVAAGNSSKDSATYSPANHSAVITVSAIADFNGQGGGGAASTCRSDVDDSFADFSNYGSPVDIAAPGVCIRSTTRGGGYGPMSGTSMASPHVAGAAALYIARYGRASTANGVGIIKNALINAAVAQGSAGGFSGDPDGSKEPLLNVQSF